MLEWFTWTSDPTAWIALATLIALEVVLGIDNIVFISILVGRLPPERRNFARTAGLLLAMLTRLALLFTITWIMRLTAPLLEVAGRALSGRDLILMSGGLFLIWKATHEIHGTIEGGGAEGPAQATVEGIASAGFAAVLVQIALIDIVFSLDSVITAVGMVNEIPIMVIAIVVTVLIMLLAARPVGEFVERHPTIKMLALAFLILIGVALVADGFGLHIPKGYIYFAMAFSVTVEMLNLRLRRPRRSTRA